MAQTFARKARSLPLAALTWRRSRASRASVSLRGSGVVAGTVRPEAGLERGLDRYPHGDDAAAAVCTRVGGHLGDSIAFTYSQFILTRSGRRAERGGYLSVGDVRLFDRTEAER